MSETCKITPSIMRSYIKLMDDFDKLDDSHMSALRCICCKTMNVTSGFKRDGETCLVRMRANLTPEKLFYEGCWYPLDKKIIGQGRFNKEGQQMAYFAMDLQAAEAEAAQSDQTRVFCRLDCMVIDADGLEFICIQPISDLKECASNPLRQSFIHFVQEMEKSSVDEDDKEKIKLATEFVGKECAKHSGEGANYDLTNSICDILLDTRKASGIIYPSTQSKLKYNNIVMKPEAADNHLKPYKCLTVEYINGIPHIRDMPVIFPGASGKDLIGGKGVRSILLGGTIVGRNYSEEVSEIAQTIIRTNQYKEEILSIGNIRELHDALYEYIEENYSDEILDNKTDILNYILQKDIGYKFEVNACRSWGKINRSRI